MGKRYFKRPPEYSAEQYTGTPESALLVKKLAKDHGHYSYTYDTGGNYDSVSVFRDDNFGRIDEKRVHIGVGFWLVMRDDGKYWALHNHDFTSEYGEIFETD